jgi:hypothetical protein
MIFLTSDSPYAWRREPVHQLHLDDWTPSWVQHLHRLSNTIETRKKDFDKINMLERILSITFAFVALEAIFMAASHTTTMGCVILAAETILKRYTTTRVATPTAAVIPITWQEMLGI